MIKELIKLANHLDKKGLAKETDYLDFVIRKMAIMDTTDDTKPSDPRTVAAQKHDAALKALVECRDTFVTNYLESVKDWTNCYKKLDGTKEGAIRIKNNEEGLAWAKSIVYVTNNTNERYYYSDGTNAFANSNRHIPNGGWEELLKAGFGCYYDYNKAIDQDQYDDDVTWEWNDMAGDPGTGACEDLVQNHNVAYDEWKKFK